MALASKCFDNVDFYPSPMILENITAEEIPYLCITENSSLQRNTFSHMI